MTAANASPELIPNTATATAIASSKLLLAAEKERVAGVAEHAPGVQQRKKEKRNKKKKETKRSNVREK